MQKVIERYYTLAEVELSLGISNRKARELLHDGEFGDQVINIGGDQRPDYRIPASGINAYLETHKIKPKPMEPGIPARTVGELRRKVNEEAA